MSMRTHIHTTSCSPDCARELDVDPASVTGSYRVVSRSGHGNRAADKPRWWPFAIIAYKALVQLCGVLGLAWLARKLGLTVGP